MSHSMPSRSLSRNVSARCGRVLSALVIAACFAFAPIIAGAFAPAQAQVQARAEFRSALAPYGRWERHSRWGEVWSPADRNRDWRPYTAGRWVYTNDWGWYWAADQAEEQWGWIVYHYGRWAWDPELGWVWVPGDEWGPGYVVWRSSADYVGWAPLPPDEIVADYWDQPDVWCFAGIRDFVSAPLLAGVILPFAEYPTLLRQTAVVNETVLLRDRHFAVNPGVPPNAIAAAVGHPLHAFDARPLVLAGTAAAIPGAIKVGAEQLRNRSIARQQSLHEARNTIAPAGSMSQLQALRRGEHGRLGSNPPHAVMASRAGQTQPIEQRRTQQQQPLQLQQPGRPEPSSATRERESAQTQGRRAAEERQAIEQRRQQLETQRRTTRERPATEGRHVATPPRQQLERRGGIEHAPPQARRSLPFAAEGRGGGGPVHAAPQNHAPAFGGGGPAMHGGGPVGGGHPGGHR